MKNTALHPSFLSTLLVPFHTDLPSFAPLSPPQSYNPHYYILQANITEAVLSSVWAHPKQDNCLSSWLEYLLFLSLTKIQPSKYSPSMPITSLSHMGHAEPRPQHFWATGPKGASKIPPCQVFFCNTAEQSSSGTQLQGMKGWIKKLQKP